MGLTLDDLRARHERIKTAREEAAKVARDKDLGYAYVLGELEQLIALLEARERESADGGGGE